MTTTGTTRTVEVGVVVEVHRTRKSDGRTFGWRGTVTDVHQVDGEVRGIELRYTATWGGSDSYPQTGHTWLAIGDQGGFLTTIH